MDWQDLKKVAETVTDKRSWGQTHLSTLPRSGRPQLEASRETWTKRKKSIEENSWRVSRAGLFEERLKGTGIILQKR